MLNVTIIECMMSNMLNLALCKKHVKPLAHIFL